MLYPQVLLHPKVLCVKKNWIAWIRYLIILPFFTGFVLKKDQKKEDKASAITIEELIEKEVMILFGGFISKYFSQTFYDIFIFNAKLKNKYFKLNI